MKLNKGENQYEVKLKLLLDYSASRKKFRRTVKKTFNQIFRKTLRRKLKKIWKTNLKDSRDDLENHRKKNLRGILDRTYRHPFHFLILGCPGDVCHHRHHAPHSG